MNDQEIEQLKAARCHGMVIYVPTGRRVERIQPLTVEPGDVAYLAGDPQGDYVALRNCSLSDFVSAWDLAAAERLAKAEELRRQAYLDGYESGKIKTLVELFKQSDKHDLLTVLFRKANDEARKSPEDSTRQHLLKGYGEGFRHCLNIMENLGDARGAYAYIVNPSILLSVTDADMKTYGD